MNRTFHEFQETNARRCNEAFVHGVKDWPVENCWKRTDEDDVYIQRADTDPALAAFAALRDALGEKP